MNRAILVALVSVILHGHAKTVGAQAVSGALVSTGWLHEHLGDPRIRVVATGSRQDYDRGHIPGAVFVEHDDTLVAGVPHRLKPATELAALLERAGIVDGMRVVLYGDVPMTTGWIYTVIAATGHAADVSLLDGNMELWRAEQRQVSTASAISVEGRLSVKSGRTYMLDAANVRGRLASPATALLDVRTDREWNGGRLPGATLVLWQDLFADLKTLKWKSPEEVRAVFAKAGVKPGQEIVTYCAVGMRASLMAWAARSVGLPAQVYVGSWMEWSQDTSNPVAK